VLHVEREERAWRGDRRPVRRQRHLRAERLQPLQLLQVDLHVAIDRLDEDRPHRGHHVPDDHRAQRRLVQAEVPGRVPRRVQHLPRLRRRPRQPDHLAVLEVPRDLHCAREPLGGGLVRPQR
jgi:hypothetical protein